MKINKEYIKNIRDLYTRSFVKIKAHDGNKEFENNIILRDLLTCAIYINVYIQYVLTNIL